MLTASAFLVTYFLACVLALARHPVFGLLAYLLAFYIHPPTRWWAYALPEIRWSMLAAAFTFAGYLIHRRKMPERPVSGSGVLIGLVLFILWIVIQFIWALDGPMHANLLDHYVKFAIAAILIYKCVDREAHLKMFLWAHVLGCFAFGLAAFQDYSGGRFEQYGGPGFADANYAGIQAVTGIFAASILMLAGKTRERLAIVFVAPFIVNGLITTMSRSSFLAFACGGLAFLWYCPPKIRFRVAVLGAVGLVGFLALSHEQFWDRMDTIKLAGQEVENVDTGGGRLTVWEAQTEMFAEHPFGCGHRCTATLSPQYLEDQYLTGPEGNRARSSHNTFLTLLVEQGIVGAVFYVLFLYWLVKAASRLHAQSRSSEGLLASALPGLVAILVAITVADVFVDYLKLEVRIWYVAIMLAYIKLSLQQEDAAVETSSKPKPVAGGVPSTR